jgi:hypothetical protein
VPVENRTWHPPVCSTVLLSVFLFKSKVRLTLRLAVYRQSFRLGAKSLETLDQGFFFELNIRSNGPYVTSSLMRGWVCRLQLLLAFASAVILRSESRGTHDHILLSQIRDFPNLEDQVPLFISPRNRVARLYSGTGFSFRCLLRLAGPRWRYSNPPPHGDCFPVGGSLLFSFPLFPYHSFFHLFLLFLRFPLLSECLGA